MRRTHAALVLLTFLFTGCSTIGNWFESDEDNLVAELKPIESKFDVSVLWQKKVGKGVGDFYSRLSPVVGYNSLYSASRDGVIKSFNVESGELQWDISYPKAKNRSIFSGFSGPTEDPISGGLSLAYQKLFFATENGNVVALDVETGAPLWKVNVGGEVLAAPAIDANLVIVSTLSGKVVALEADTGDEKWSFVNEVPPLSLRGTAPPTTSGGGVMIGSALGKLSVLLVEDGRVAWEQSLATKKGKTELDRIADVDAKPLVIGGVVYASAYDGTLAALELRSGRVIWKREYRSFHAISALANTLFVVDKDSVVYALDRLSGVELWSQTELRGRGLSAATGTNSSVVIGDMSGYLHWLSAETGEFVARQLVPGADTGFHVAPLKHNDTLYVQSKTGTLSAISLR